MTKIFKVNIKYLIRLIVSLSTAVFFAIFFRIFIGEFYLIPSDSMEETLKIGDLILVNKLKYCAKLPSSLNEVPFVGDLFNVDTANSVQSIRMRGYGTLNYNDIVVFITPSPNSSISLIKHCISLPGDSLQIIDNDVFINGKYHPDKPTFQFQYISTFTYDFLKLNLQEKLCLFKFVDTSHLVIIVETNVASARYAESLGVKMVKLKNTSWHKTIFPPSKTGIWNLYNYGPLIIPKRGMTISLNQNTFSLYHSIIRNYEKTSIRQIDNHFFAGGIQIERYTFKNDYYFVLGDNRHNAYDSRYFGFVHKQLIQRTAVTCLINIKDYSRFYEKI